MNLATGCDHAWLIYRTVRRPAWTVRYRRCSNCGATSKSIAKVFIDQRNWLERGDLLPDRRDTDSQIAIIGNDDSLTEQENFDDERYNWFT
jgi:hypothetical protein